uniref:Uncharacterized protein n=1 Tax=Sinocyclocheilus rhinocerous TaxID=307959 RepID=A0A673JS70_9TELE
MLFFPKDPQCAATLKKANERSIYTSGIYDQSEKKTKKGKGERREGLNIDFSCCADQSASMGHVQNQFCLMSGHHNGPKILNSFNTYTATITHTQNRLGLLCSVKCANNKITVIVKLCELLSQQIRIKQCGVSYYLPHGFFFSKTFLKIVPAPNF